MRGAVLRVVVLIEPRTEREAEGGDELHECHVAVAVVVDELDELIELRLVHLASIYSLYICVAIVSTAGRCKPT